MRVIASARARRGSASELRQSIREQEQTIEDPAAFGRANARFHEQLVELAGNQTLTVMAEMLNEIVAKAVTAVEPEGAGPGLGADPSAGDPLAGTARGADRGR